MKAIQNLRKIAIGFGVATASLLAATQPAQAIITFTPSGTGTVSTGTNLAWDMESSSTLEGGSASGIYEFQLSNHGDIHFNSLNNIVTLSGGSTGADILAPGTLIGSSSTFSPNTFAGTTDYGGEFTSESTGILGVQFQINNQTHYGWVEIAFSGGNQSLLQWAYEEQPNTPILAGATASTPVPFEFSPTLGFVAVGGILGLSRLRKNMAAKKAVNNLSA